MDRYGARLLDDCEVLRLEAQGERVTGVTCRHEGKEFRVESRIVVLAAGALASPALLLRSASPDWPFGLANRSGLVGRNLMRHFVDLYAVFPKRRGAASGNTKEIGWSDCYLGDGEKFGSFQSFGAMPPARMVMESAREEIAGRLGAWAGLAASLAKPFLPLVDRVLSRALVFATIMEDLPYPDNQVLPSAGASGDPMIGIRYRIRDADARRIARFRKRVADVLKPYRFLLFRQAENNQRLAHACGTCRFGTDPRESVLDANNKAHGLANLYVVDASFFPSSGGTNPALTIAANALRVADHLIAG